MRTMRILTIPVMLASAVYAADFYVSPTGSDAKPGTKSEPFATIAWAGKAVAAGDTVHVAPGSYAGGFVTAADGTATARIRYVSDVKWGARINKGSGDQAWWNRGDYSDIVGFEIDGTAAPTWRHGLYLNGSHVTASGNKVHAILIDPSAPATHGWTAAGGDPRPGMAGDAEVPATRPAVRGEPGSGVHHRGRPLLCPRAVDR
jgi:hypothetical protein